MALLTDNITYGGKEPDSPAASIFFKPMAEEPTFRALGFDILTGVKAKQKIYLTGRLDKITKKRVGCTTADTGANAQLGEKFINPVDLEAKLSQCAGEFDANIFAYSKKNGYDVNNLEGTELEKVLVDMTTPALSRDALRILFLSDTALTDPDYNQLDGAWKKWRAGVAGGTIKRSSTLADNAMDAPDAAIALFTKMHRDASRALKRAAKAEKVFWVTDSIAENYEDSLTRLNTLETNRAALIDGIEVLTFKGIKVIPISLLDEYIEADFSPAANPDSPHRAVYTVMDNHKVAMDEEADTTSIEFWYNRDEDMNKWRARYKLAYEYVFDDLIVVAY